MESAGKGDLRDSVLAVSRREFLGSCAACAAGASFLSAVGTSSAMALDNRAVPVLGDAPALGGGTRSKIRVVLAYPSPKGPIWPNIGYDFESHNRQFMEKLSNACPSAEFLPATVMSPGAAKKVADKDGEIDGYIVYLSGCLWGSTPDVIAATGKPVIYADHLYAGSGEFLTAYGRARRNGMKVAAVSSSRIEDVADAARCIDAIAKLRKSKMLVVGGQPDDHIEKVFGTKVAMIEFAELNDAYNKADKKAAEQKADEWMKGAEKVIEPGREEIIKSAAMYLAMSELLSRHSAQAITVNCLGGHYSGKITAYPCLGFMQLNNDGFIGACEADKKSTITMLLMTYLTGRPGFISDPVIDTSKNQIIYAHCVAPTKVFGPNGSSNPYHLRSHSEDRRRLRLVAYAAWRDDDDGDVRCGEERGDYAPGPDR